MEDMRIGKHQPRTQLVTCAPADTRILVKALVMVETWTGLGTERKREREVNSEKGMSGGMTVHTQQLHSSTQDRGNQAIRVPVTH